MTHCQVALHYKDGVALEGHTVGDKVADGEDNSHVAVVDTVLERQEEDRQDSLEGEEDMAVVVVGVVVDSLHTVSVVASKTAGLNSNLQH